MKEVEMKNALFMKQQFGTEDPNLIGHMQNMNPFNQQQEQGQEEEEEQNKKKGQNNPNMPPFKPKGKGSLKFGNMKGSRLPTRQSSE